MTVHEIRANSTEEQTWLDGAFKQIADKTSEIYRSLVASFPRQFIGDASFRTLRLGKSKVVQIGRNKTRAILAIRGEKKAFEEQDKCIGSF